MTEKEIKKEIERIENENNKLEKKEKENYNSLQRLYKELDKFDEEKAMELLEEINVGDRFIKIDNFVTYHYDPLILYEITEKVKGKQTFKLTTRKYIVHCCDGDFSTIIEKENMFRADNILNLREFKKISEETYKEEVLPILLNPDIVEDKIKTWN